MSKSQKCIENPKNDLEVQDLKFASIMIIKREEFVFQLVFM
jgi:hypothetical protein